jgi:lambda repressor-like predicted transcriptional regulator
LRLIQVFKRRVLEEIEAHGITLSQFAKKRVGVRRTSVLRAKLDRESLRLRWVELIAGQLGILPSQLLTDGLEVESGTFPPVTETVQKSVTAALNREGLSLRQTATAMGLTPQALSKDLVTGNIGLDRLEQIAGIVEVEPWRLILPVGTLVEVEESEVVSNG